MTDEAPERAPDASPPPGSSRRKLSKRAILLIGGMVVLCAIIAIDVVVIAGSTPPTLESSAPVPVASSAELAVAPPAPPSAESPGGDEEPFEEELPSEAPSLAKTAPVISTVQEAAQRACSTSSVEGLTRQILAEARCLDPKAFVPVPSRPNLVAGKAASLYLSASARDHLLKALDANKHLTLNVNSALRSVAQQYLVSRWGAGKRCGVQLAALPGESNHETGLALDIKEPHVWRTALEKEGFKWMGSIDRVHFDYAGKGAVSKSQIDIRAFQRLWNRNHSDDRITESGRFDSATETRLKKSPAAGFKRGAECGKK